MPGFSISYTLEDSIFWKYYARHSKRHIDISKIDNNAKSVYCMHLITFFYKDKHVRKKKHPETYLRLIDLKNITNKNVTTNFH